MPGGVAGGEEISQGTNVQKVNENFQRSRSLASRVCLQLSLASVWELIVLNVLRIVVLTVWYNISLSVVCVIKVALFAT
jgi:hypothetical protein